MFCVNDSPRSDEAKGDDSFWREDVDRMRSAWVLFGELRICIQVKTLMLVLVVPFFTWVIVMTEQV